MFFLHYAQNISKAFSTSFIFLTYKISSWELNELIISFFKFSKRLTIYVRVTPKPATYFVNLETSLELLPFFALTLEYLLHNSHILSYFNWCKSIDPIKFNNSKDILNFSKYDSSYCLLAQLCSPCLLMIVLEMFHVVFQTFIFCLCHMEYFFSDTLLFLVSLVFLQKYLLHVFPCLNIIFF